MYSAESSSSDVRQQYKRKKFRYPSIRRPAKFKASQLMLLNRRAGAGTRGCPYFWTF